MNRKLSLPARLGSLGRWLVASAAMVIGIAAVAFASTASPAAARPAAGAAPALDIVPKPVSATVGSGRFTLDRSARIVAVPGAGTAAELSIADDLAAYLRPATGYPLPAVVGAPAPGDIVLKIGDPEALKPAGRAEGYQLDTTASSSTIEAPTTHGLYNGVQTFRQLLSPWVNSATVAPGPWTMPVVTITDYPRYQYRGVMLDIGRHYEAPAAVEKLIAQVAAYKINVFHLHLSDDQGFRLAIAGFPRLTASAAPGRWEPAAGRPIPADSGPRHSTGRSSPMPPPTSSR
jgi:hexosaminidase